MFGCMCEHNPIKKQQQKQQQKNARKKFVLKKIQDIFFYFHVQDQTLLTQNEKKM